MSQDGGQGRYAGRALAGGRYQLRDLLGEGGMASVHLAYDSVLDRQVAIKTLHTELGREQAFRERFRREAQAVAKLTHTNIVSVFDTGEDDLDGMTTPYIVMEYVEGRPLGSVLDEDVRQQGAMPADKALKITADVLAALEISHEMGLVHRDIKPGNVMMTKRGVVKVMDFGIARAMQSGVTSMTQTGMVVGTPQYLSPEQALGRGVDARSDLYSVGIMLFQLVTGRLPFDADSPLAIAYAHVQEQPVAPSAVNRALPPAVDALVARALKKNPNERFPSAEAMRDECLRVAASFQAAPPSIVPGAQTSSGAGVGSAVFPPVGQGTPAPTGPVQTPYQPTPSPGPNPYGTPAPAAHSPAYGYPQQAGYQTPAPAPYAQQQAAATPPPYNLTPSAQGSGSGSPGGKSNKPVIIGSIVVAVVAVGGLIGALLMNGGGDEDPEAGGGGSSTASVSASPSKAAGYRGPDKEKTIEKDKCTEPQESYNDPDKIQVPDFTFKYIGSVKECFNAAGWQMKVVEVDENTYGEGSVRDQFPTAGTDVDPENMPEIQLKVSTGNPPSE
ncbi:MULTISPECIES: Stk1 family PASTA domain-containing Ser/Thr kinase [Streptomyces]|uniref:Serine/threonine-protein kinase PksC n=4 Tax=Actinomycetes TaxID=1760 RepID=PKSC_STRCO|nr:MULTISPECIES: Stk1 family PASTA domain-containing Ser/Thr kinase [Streptomyces]Q9S2C0.1 RecName: Full=Serine/threonine-protein kinase PksC [Streptomyces coelicolor A3(2)]WTC49995.1 protein kinase [Streptomyces anthocyanicus]MBQ0952569.1 protein kinase [Streptomyces sp. RK76]MDX2925126.1 protein kinase [Streptomyces sp. NRRL_B-16638]MDX3407398.1 protein kinase [Streptomyces sp. ME02-6977A]MYU43343.1 protein kinase [Streptomyces sp. SID7813]